MFESLILVALVATLAFSIVDDWRNYMIRNEVIVILLALFTAKTIGRGDYAQLATQFALAGAMFAALLTIYARGWMGGGDVKLLALAFLWIGAAKLSTFAILMCVLVIVYYFAAKLKLVPSRGQAKVYIPFAPCISGAWLLTLALSYSEIIPH